MNTSILRQRRLAIVLIVSVLFTVGAFFVRSQESGGASSARVSSSELGFLSYSPRGVSGGAVIPASCESDFSHFPGECSPSPAPALSSVTEVKSECMYALQPTPPSNFSGVSLMITPPGTKIADYCPTVLSGKPVARIRVYASGVSGDTSQGYIDSAVCSSFAWFPSAFGSYAGLQFFDMSPQNPQMNKTYAWDIAYKSAPNTPLERGVITTVGSSCPASIY